VANGESNAYLVFDLLTGVNPKNMAKLNTENSTSIISTSEIPTGDMVRSTAEEYPEASFMIDLIKEYSKDSELLNATELSEHFFGSNMQANFIVIGAAYQSGSIPLSNESIERAIKINGVAVKQNTDAFNIGRKVVSDPHWIDTINLYRSGNLANKPILSPEAISLIDSISPDDALKHVLEFRTQELIDYQNLAFAKEYISFVDLVYNAEKELRSNSELSQNVAKYLFKLMATKDEYEVARLSLKTELDSAISKEFGKSAKISYMLHPPFLKAMQNIPILNRLPGVKSKLALGSWFKIFYVMLKNMKFLRGTAFDFMAWFSSDVRKADQKALNYYKSTIMKNIDKIGNGEYQSLKDFSILPDIIRGYEEVRLESMEKYYKESHSIFKS
jgi:indolepyruvate ferredoxin oxidoreductase